jgi:hypothetical protein
MNEQHATQETQKTRRKPGPVPGPERRQFTILIDPDLGEWGKQQPGGLSELIRRLLHQAKADAERKAARS